MSFLSEFSQNFLEAWDSSSSGCGCTLGFLLPFLFWGGLAFSALVAVAAAVLAIVAAFLAAAWIAIQSSL